MNSVPGSMWEWMGAMQSDERFVLCVVTIVFGTVASVLMVAIVAYVVRRIHQSRLDDSLKRELLDRGLSVDEIAKLVGPLRGGKPPRPVPRRDL